MSSAFANRRKPRKIGGDEEENDEGGGQGSESVVKKPVHPRSKQKSKARVSFGAGETSMNDNDEKQSEVITPKRHGLGKRAVEKSALQRGLAPENIPLRVGVDQDRPSYNEDTLKELRNSTPVTPKTMTEKEKERTVDVAAKFGEVMKVSTPSALPSEAEIREKKERRARLAHEHNAGLIKEEEYISLNDPGQVDELDPNNQGDESIDTRLIRDDEDFAEGFDEFVEDGKISLGRKAEREQKRRQREEMRELIDDAGAASDEEDSDFEEKAAYEANQTRAAMGHGGRDNIDRPRTPPKMSALPHLSNSTDRLRTNLAIMEKSRTQMINRMEDLRKEKAEIAAREVEIQALIKEAGDNYEKLKLEAGVAPGSDEASMAGELQVSRGLDNIGAPMAISSESSGNES